MKNGASPALVIVLPCYNPASGWAERVEAWVAQLRADLPQQRFAVAVVDDGSSAPSNDEARRLGQRLPEFHWIAYADNRGKGHALRTGFAAFAEADYFVFTDIDLPYTRESFLAVCSCLTDARADVAVGVRDAAYYAQIPLRRRILSLLLRKVLALALRLPVDDTQCGLKGFNRAGYDVFRRTRIDQFLFDVEFLHLAGRKRGLRVEAVPVTLNPYVELSSIGMGVLFRELFNLFRILRTRKLD